jgi:hypothetical protein
MLPPHLRTPTTRLAGKGWLAERLSWTIGLTAIGAWAAARRD